MHPWITAVLIAVAIFILGFSISTALFGNEDGDWVVAAIPAVILGVGYGVRHTPRA